MATRKTETDMSVVNLEHSTNLRENLKKYTKYVVQHFDGFQEHRYNILVYEKNEKMEEKQEKTTDFPSRGSTQEQYVTPDTIINPVVYEFLKNYTKSLQPSERFIVLAFNEYKLTDVAPSTYKHSEEHPPNFIIVCICFIKLNVYQPIGTLFLYNDTFTSAKSPTPKDLADCLRLYIMAVAKTSLKIIATVAPPSVTFKKALSDLIRVQDMAAYTAPLVYSVGDVKDIVHIYDPPSMLKAFRNLLLHQDIEYRINGKAFSASWKDILNLHRKGELPFLSNEHVAPSNKISHTSCAASVFSNKVSSALTKSVTSGLSPESAMGTSILLKMINDIFDSFNASENEDVPTRKLIRSSSFHFNFWSKALKFLETLYFLEKGEFKKNKVLKTPYNKLPYVKTFAGESCERELKELDARARGLLSNCLGYSDATKEITDDPMGDIDVPLVNRKKVAKEDCFAEKVIQSDEKLKSQLHKLQNDGKTPTQSFSGGIRVVSDEFLFDRPPKRNVSKDEDVGAADNDIVDNALEEDMEKLSCGNDEHFGLIEEIVCSEQSDDSDLNNIGDSVEIPLEKCTPAVDLFTDFTDHIQNDCCESRKHPNTYKLRANFVNHLKNNHYEFRRDVAKKSTHQKTADKLPCQVDSVENFSNHEKLLNEINVASIIEDHSYATEQAPPTSFRASITRSGDINGSEETASEERMDGEGNEERMNGEGNEERMDGEGNEERMNGEGNKESNDDVDMKKFMAEFARCDVRDCYGFFEDTALFNMDENLRCSQNGISHSGGKLIEMQELANCGISKTCHTSCGEEACSCGSAGANETSKTQCSKDVCSCEASICSSVDIENKQNGYENGQNRLKKRAVKSNRKKLKNLIYERPEIKTHNIQPNTIAGQNGTVEHLSSGKNKDAFINDKENVDHGYLATDENPEETVPLNNTSYKEKVISKDSIKKLGVYTENDTHGNKNKNKQHKTKFSSDKTDVNNSSNTINTENNTHGLENSLNHKNVNESSKNTVTEKLIEKDCLVLRDNKMINMKRDSDNNIEINKRVKGEVKNQKSKKKKNKNGQNCNPTVNTNLKVNGNASDKMPDSIDEGATRNGNIEQNFVSNGYSHDSPNGAISAQAEIESNNIKVSDLRLNLENPDLSEKMNRFIVENGTGVSHVMSSLNTGAQVPVSERIDHAIQEMSEMPGFESDSEPDMPAIPISDIIEKLEGTESRRFERRSYIKHEVTNNWISSIKGMQKIVETLQEKGFRQINSSAFNIDYIHEYVCNVRNSNIGSVEKDDSFQKSPCKMLDDIQAMVAMQNGSALLIS